MSSESFKTMIDELLRYELIQRNGSGNPYGANSFDTTLYYEKLLAENAYKMAKTINDLIMSGMGYFVGSIINQCL